MDDPEFNLNNLYFCFNNFKHLIITFRLTFPASPPLTRLILILNNIKCDNNKKYDLPLCNNQQLPFLLNEIDFSHLLQK